ncbi:MAG: cytochrome c oxidase subunit I [Pseudanabaenaceae cyanobacterium bins.68]|nr:cytochrome c oxidase subunit I [Pseudanabaenaceae cyanobacterium bins.68]
MTTSITDSVTTHPSSHPERHWWDYFTFCVDHKVIGIQYLVTTFFFYLVGGVLASVVRGELATPDPDLPPGMYNQMFTMHGTIMIFLWIVPAVTGGFGNFLVPLMIGARDMAFPKLNAIAFWMIIPGAVLLMGSFFVGSSESGWTAYPPLSLITEFKVGQAMWIFSILILGTSSILAAVNFVVTIWAMRMPSMDLFQMPLFCWAMLATSCLVIVATPVLAGAMILLAFDLLVGTSFFNPTGGGNPVVYQHLFWFYSHPAVYVMVLPVFGMISEILPVHARKPIFGYKAIAYSSMFICVLGLLVWAHHMFTSGTPDWLRVFFMVATLLVAVPTGIKVFSWVATIWGGKLRLNSAMLFALGFVSMFVVGGLSGVMLASVPIDIHVHDTYFVVGHFHYVLFGGSVFGIYAGLYHWYPKMVGRMLNEFWGKVHFGLTFVGFNLCFLPMHLLGLQGMPRRVAQYDPQFATINVICSVGAFILAISTFPFLINAIWSWFKGTQAIANPWHALTLEWTTASPPIVENWEGEPELLNGPYDYGFGITYDDQGYVVLAEAS